MTEHDKIILDLIESARPFLDANIVDETSGTVMLMERLEKAIEAAENEISQVADNRRLS